MGGVAHEVAVQPATILRGGEVVVGQGEVVHADVGITSGSELFDRHLQQPELDLRRRQVGLVDLPLRLEHRRQVGVAVDGESIRACLRHRIQRAGEAFRVLLGQAVDEIDVDRPEAVLAAGLDDRHRLLDALDAVDRLLHDRIEILHAEAGTVEADCGQLGDVGRRDEARIEFDRQVAIAGVGKMEVAAQRFHHLAQLRGREEVGRAAAEVQLDDLAIAVEQLGHHRDLAVQADQVGLATAEVAGDDAVAAAVEARAHAKRHVHVQRQPPGDRVAVARCRAVAQLRLAERRGELRRRRVGRVAGTGTVVALEQRSVECGESGHGPQATQPAAGPS